MRHMQVTAEAREELLVGLREGAYLGVAAEAAGLPADTVEKWVRLGDMPRAREPYKTFAREVHQAAAQARRKAEAEMLKKSPEKWLRCGPGKEVHGKPGWTTPVKPREDPRAGQRDDWVCVGIIRRVLDKYPDAQQAVTDALVARPEVEEVVLELEGFVSEPDDGAGPGTGAGEEREASAVAPGRMPVSAVSLADVSGNAPVCGDLAPERSGSGVGGGGGSQDSRACQETSCGESTAGEGRTAGGSRQEQAPEGTKRASAGEGGFPVRAAGGGGTGAAERAAEGAGTEGVKGAARGEENRLGGGGGAVSAPARGSGEASSPVGGGGERPAAGGASEVAVSEPGGERGPGTGRGDPRP